MYHIEQLRGKELAELQSIAQNLGIKGIKSLDRNEIIYRILDGQAFQSSQSGAPAVVKEESRMNRRNHKRARISSSDASKVYTATGDKAVKLDKNEAVKVNEESQVAPIAPHDAAIEQVNESVQNVQAAIEPVDENVAEASAPKKRGRKAKAKTEAVAATVETAVEEKAADVEPAVENTTVEPANETSAPKKRGRKPKAKVEAVAMVEETSVEETIVAEAPVEESFVPIEDLPTEKDSVPAELIGKFEKRNTQQGGARNDRQERRQRFEKKTQSGL